MGWYLFFDIVMRKPMIHRSEANILIPLEGWFKRGDWDGFIGLFIDNLLQIMLIAVLCPAIAGLPDELIVTRILPAVALSILFGNIFYAIQARRLAVRTGRDDVTALPYGINTVSLIAYIFLIMGPLYRETQNPELVWQAGVFACLGSGVLELIGSFVADPLRRWLPRAALLAALAGVAITFISMGFAFQIFAFPAVSVIPMLLIVCAYAGRWRLPFGVPSGLFAILLGIVVAWALRGAGWVELPQQEIQAKFGLHLPAFDFGRFWEFLADGDGWQYMTVIFPMALFNLIGSLQNLESAAAAGDEYPTRSSLAMNGIGSIVAAGFGSAFPTTIYIGHPGWKAMGAGYGYSLLDGIVVALLCFFGAIGVILDVVPIEVTLGILIWIGIVIVGQALGEVPKEHGVAVAIGLLPAMAAWAQNLVESSVQAAGGTLAEVLPDFGSSLYIHGLLALSQGFLITSMIFASVVVFSIERRFLAAAIILGVAAVLSLFGLIHAYEVSPSGVEARYAWLAAPQFAFAYGALAVALLVAWCRRRSG